jgi:hypothetical protein
MLPKHCIQCRSADLSDGEVFVSEDQSIGFRISDPGMRAFSTDEHVNAVACETCGFIYLYKTPQRPESAKSILLKKMRDEAKKREASSQDGSQEAGASGDMSVPDFS